MSIDTNITFTGQSEVDDKLRIAVAENLSANQYMHRTTTEDIAHSNEQMIAHPTIDGLYLSGESHLLTEGSVAVEYRLGGLCSAQQRANYMAWTQSNDDGAVDAAGGTYTYDAAEDKITLVYTVEFGTLTWSRLPCSYGPLSTKAGMVFNEGATLVCCLRVDGEPDAWTVRYRDIPANTTAVIDKTDTNTYVFFTQPVTKDGTQLNKFQLYKITSSSITVSASQNCKVVRFTRD